MICKAKDALLPMMWCRTDVVSLEHQWAGAPTRCCSTLPGVVLASASACSTSFTLRTPRPSKLCGHSSAMICCRLQRSRRRVSVIVSTCCAVRLWGCLPKSASLTRASAILHVCCCFPALKHDEPPPAQRRMPSSPPLPLPPSSPPSAPHHLEAVPSACDD